MNKFAAYLKLGLLTDRLAKKKQLLVSAQAKTFPIYSTLYLLLRTYSLFPYMFSVAFASQLFSLYSCFSCYFA
jgi:hypothetical protein